MRQVIFRFFSSGLDGNHSGALRRMITAKAFLLIMASICFVAIFLNLFLTFSLAIAVLDAIAFLITVIALIDLHKNKVIQRANMVGVGNLFFLLLTFVYMSQANKFSIIWTIFFPIFTIPLLGHKKGLVVSTIYYCILFVLAYRGIGVWDDGAWNRISFLRFFLSSTVLTYLMYAYESAFYHANQELRKIHEKEIQYLEELQYLSTTDPLTGLFNRRRMYEALELQMNNTQRYQEQFSLIIFDIDDFKHINDHYGHNVGDDVLKAIAESVKNIVRKTDYVCRWGGEEFLVLLPKIKQEDAVVIAEKLRVEIEALLYPQGLHVTCSFGVAQYKEGIAINDLINSADQALYHAKKIGKNTVCEAF